MMRRRRDATEEEAIEGACAELARMADGKLTINGYRVAIGHLGMNGIEIIIPKVGRFVGSFDIAPQDEEGAWQVSRYGVN